MNAPAAPIPPSPSAGRTWVVAFAVLTLLLLAAGWWYYRSEAKTIRAHRHEEIAAIGALKAGQIQHWRQERLNDATRMAGGPLVRKAVTEFLREPGGPLRADLLARLQIERTAGGYADALIFAPDGQLLLAAQATPVPPDPATQRLLAAARASREAVLSDFFRLADGTIQIAVAAAVRDAAGQPLAVAVLSSDATAYLYPLIQSWPTPSHSGETFIVRREGDSVVWLNAARHQTNTALTLRQPLSRLEIPAVQAALGRQGVFEGVDYRGAKVLSDLRPIAGTPWFLVAKVDTTEIFAEVRSRTGLIALAVGSLILLAAAVTAFLYRQEHAAEVIRFNTYNRSLIEASLDPLVTISVEGKITDVNAATEQVTGRARGELIGTDFSDYFTAPEQARAGYRQVFSEGLVRDYPLAIRHQDGRVTEVLYNASVFKAEQGQVLGVFAAARDITQRKQAETERGQYFKLFTTSNDLMCIADPNGAFLKTNPACTRTLGYSEAELVSQPFVEFIHPEDKQPTLDEMARQQRLGYSLNFENRYRCKDGSYRWLSWRASFIREEGLTYATARDVTELKRAEEEIRQFNADLERRVQQRTQALRESDERFQVAARATNDVIWDWNLLTNGIWWNEAFQSVFGYRAGEMEPGVESWSSRLHPEDAARVQTDLQRVIDGGGNRWSDEYRFRRADGTFAFVFDRREIMRDGRGKPVRMVGAIMDITGRKQAEAALADAKRALERERDILQAVMDGAKDFHLVYLDRDFNFVRVNETYARTCGFPPGEMIGKNHFALYPHPENEAIFARVRDTGEPVTCHDKPFEFPDHPERGVTYWDWTLTPVKGPGGQVAGLVFSLFETTGRKRIEETLRFLVDCGGQRSGEGFFPALARYLGQNLGMDFVCIDRLEEGLLAAQTLAVYYDGKFEDNMSYTLQDTPCGSVVGKSVCCFPKGVRQQFPKDTVLQEMRAESYVGVTLWGACGQPVGLIAVIGRQPLADPTLAEAVLKLVSVRAAGELERQQAEAALRESEERLRLVLQASTTGTFAVDLQTGEGRWNDVEFELLGLRPGEVSPGLETFFRLVHPEDIGALRTRWEEATQTGKLDVEFRIVRADRQERWLAGKGHFVFEHQSAAEGAAPAGRALRYLGVNFDITERKRAELDLRKLTAELKAANQELESFSYAVSHDLRAPLRAMCGFSQALVEDYGTTLQGEARVYLEQIIRASRHMSELVDGLLILSRCTRGELRREVVDLSALCERLRGELSRAEPGRQVEWQIQPDLVARGDPRMIEVVMNNLLGNAWKYTARQAAPVIRVYAEPADGRPCFCVADNGAGFDMKHTEQLFKPFQRLHRQEEFPGTGIGLATVQRILHRHGGTIHATAAVGQGATFKFSLPELDTLNPSSL